MKFSFKLLVWTMIVMALGFGFSGFYFVNYVFQTALEREVSQTLDDSSILRFAFETAALNVPAKYDVLQDTTVGQIASNLESGGHNARRMLRLSDEQRNVLYASSGFDIDNRLLDQTGPDAKSYRVVSRSGSYYIQTGTTVNALDRVLYLETMRDVSEVFHERALGFSVYRQVTIAMLVCGTVIMHLIASLLTRPIRLLTRATKRMASGDYHYRARKVSSDELGQLTIDFNQMANALEDNINKLEDEIQSREDFVAAFAHELKNAPHIHYRICRHAPFKKAGRGKEFCVGQLYLYGRKAFGGHVLPSAGHHGHQTRRGGVWSGFRGIPVFVPL